MTTALLLHGFGGRGDGLAALHDAAGRYRLLAPDLRGHGAAARRRPVDLDAVLGDLEPLLRDAAAAGPVVVGGYSLGGRLALQLAVARPGLVSGLLLVSTTAGLEDEDERDRRRDADDALAADLRRDGLAAFASRWAGLPLWDGDPPAARAAQAAELRGQDPDGLAAALSGLSPGRLSPLWGALGDLDVPTAVLVGERDGRYRALAERLATGLPRAAVTTVAGAGHGLVREAPGAVRGALGDLAARVRATDR